MPVRIFHNPRCSKSRHTLQLLRDRGLEPEIIEYLKTPPSTDQLRHILNLLGMGPRALMRRNERVYSEAELDDPNLDDAALIQAMVDHPILIERPIVLAQGKAIIGRPPEKVLEIV
ncbi:MAG: arsenate reductase (glutaredoxin) [Gammaproteobacteria bacterium]|jgi:arsenate reductase